MAQLTRKRYPVGLQTFSELREKNYVYIDKTTYVYEMAHADAKYLFLSRPRRFGKSLLTSTLRSYFEGRKELFEGLAIEQLETEWTAYPVLHFDMSTAKHVGEKQLVEEINGKLVEYEKIYGRDESHVNLNQRMEGLIKHAYEQTGKQVVVLIDEYDAPLLDVMHEEENLPVLRNFYNPYRLVNAFSDKKIDSYWFGSGTPTYLIEMLRKYGMTPIQLGGEMKAGKEEFDAPTERLTSVVPLLYQSGYITIKDGNPWMEMYTLGIPNREVRIGLMKSLVPYYLTPNTFETSSALIRMTESLYKDDMESMLQQLQTFLSTIPYTENTHYEGHYQQVLYVIFSLLGMYTDVEVRTSTGRIDVVMRTPSTLYIIELKIDKDADAAMRQIDLKQYPERFSLSNLPMVKVGINFDSERRTLTDWIIKRENK